MGKKRGGGPKLHTLHELLVGVLLEEGVVADGPREVINHKLHDGFNLFLRIARVKGNGFVLVWPVSDYIMA